MAIWARPDLAHCVSVLGRYVHNPSQKHLNAYLRVARYLIKTKDLRIVYGTQVVISGPFIKILLHNHSVNIK